MNQNFVKDTVANMESAGVVPTQARMEFIKGATLTPEEVKEFEGLANEILASSKPTFKEVPTAKVQVDSAYQRTLNPRRVADIVKNFDPRRFQPLEISQRTDGSLWCMEGQHRLAVARELNLETVPAMVHTGLKSTDEAILFWLFQRDRRALNFWDAFSARLYGKEEAAVEIDKAIRDAGVTYGNASHYDVQALATCENLYNLGGPELLRQTLQFCDETWPLSNRRFDGMMISGIGIILNQYAKWERFDMGRFTTVMSSTSPAYMIAEVKLVRSHQSAKDKISYGAATLMRELYNKRLGSARQLPPIKPRIAASAPIRPVRPGQLGKLKNRSAGL